MVGTMGDYMEDRVSRSQVGDLRKWRGSVQTMSRIVIGDYIKSRFMAGSEMLRDYANRLEGELDPEKLQSLAREMYTSGYNHFEGISSSLQTIANKADTADPDVNGPQAVSAAIKNNLRHLALEISPRFRNEIRNSDRLSELD